METQQLNKDQMNEVVGMVISALESRIDAFEAKWQNNWDSLSEDREKVKADIEYIKDGYNDMTQTVNNIVNEMGK